MDQPTEPVPPFGPPELHDDVRSGEWTPTVPLPEAPIVLPSAPPTGRFAILGHRMRATARSVRAQVSRFGLAIGVSIPVGIAISLAIGLVPFATGDRRFWDAEVRFVFGYWYLVVAAIASVVPVTFTVLRDGWDPAAELVIDRRYWRFLVAACVVLPAVVAVIVFVASHLFAVLLTIIAILAILLSLIIGGGGF